MDEPTRRRAAEAAHVADRFDQLAETAELMDDEATANRFRRLAAHSRLTAMGLLDG